MSRRAPGWLLWCGVVGPPLFVAVFLVEGATRRGYDPVRLPISLLSLGPTGWTQTLNFIIDGALVIGFAIGLRASLPRLSWASAAGPAMIGLMGLGLIGAGIFPTDPGGGYPPGVRVSVAQSTGWQHDLSTLVVFASLVAGCLVLGRHLAVARQGRWAAYSIATGVLVALGFALMVIGFNGSNDVTPVAGLVMRVTVVAGWSWLTLVALHEVRERRGHPPET
jgi:hypothetical protein